MLQLINAKLAAAIAGWTERIVKDKQHSVQAAACVLQAAVRGHHTRSLAAAAMGNFLLAEKAANEAKAAEEEAAAKMAMVAAATKAAEEAAAKAAEEAAAKAAEEAAAAAKAADEAAATEANKKKAKRKAKLQTAAREELRKNQAVEKFREEKAKATQRRRESIKEEALALEEKQALVASMKKNAEKQKQEKLTLERKSSLNLDRLSKPKPRRKDKRDKSKPFEQLRLVADSPLPGVCPELPSVSDRLMLLCAECVQQLPCCSSHLVVSRFVLTRMCMLVALPKIPSSQAYKESGAKVKRKKAVPRLAEFLLAEKKSSFLPQVAHAGRFANASLRDLKMDFSDAPNKTPLFSVLQIVRKPGLSSISSSAPGRKWAR